MIRVIQTRSGEKVVKSSYFWVLTDCFRSPDGHLDRASEPDGKKATEMVAFLVAPQA
jgi:hypothetical protein